MQKTLRKQTVFVGFLLFTQRSRFVSVRRGGVSPPDAHQSPIGGRFFTSFRMTITYLICHSERMRGISDLLFYGRFVNCPNDPSSVICFANATFPQGGRLLGLQTGSKLLKKAPLSKGAVTEGDWGIQRCLQRSVFGQLTRRRFFAALRMTITHRFVILNDSKESPTDYSNARPSQEGIRELSSSDFAMP